MSEQNLTQGKFVQIVAVHDKYGYIAINNIIPWNCTQDTRFFRQVTMGHPIVMTKSLYEDIGHHLDGRSHIVVVRPPLEHPTHAIGPSGKAHVRVCSNKQLRSLFSDPNFQCQPILPDEHRKVFKDNVCFIIGGPVAYNGTSSLADAALVVRIKENENTPLPKFEVEDTLTYQVPPHLNHLAYYPVPDKILSDTHHIANIELWVRNEEDVKDLLKETKNDKSVRGMPHIFETKVRFNG